jgi:hypothetical protein
VRLYNSDQLTHGKNMQEHAPHIMTMRMIMIIIAIMSMTAVIVMVMIVIL